MKVRITATASTEIEGILAWIAKDNPTAATAVGRTIKAAIARLRYFPRIGAETDEPGVYMKIVRQYRYLIFYAIDNKEVIVRNVRHPARRRPSKNA